MRSQPLRVAVTRDEPSDGALSDALRRAGLEPIGCAVLCEAPAPEPERLARAARELGRYDWLVVASVRAIVALSAARDGEPWPAGPRTAAVGARTAAALIAHGAATPLLAPREGAQPLITALREADDWTQRRVLLPRAREGSHELGIALRNFGARVEEVVAYCTVERAADEILAAWNSASADAVVVASPSAARSLVRAVGPDTLRRLDSVVAIGSTTAMALVSLGVQAVVPPRADFESVAELLSERTPSTRRTDQP